MNAVPELSNTDLPAGLITPEFDIAALTVEELREEMAMRNLTATGSKAALCDRLTAAIQQGRTPPGRLTTPIIKKKRPHTRKEPKREDYASQEEFEEAYTKWRQARDNNNLSVKKSRENQRMQREKHERICREREEQNR